MSEGKPASTNCIDIYRQRILDLVGILPLRASAKDSNKTYIINSHYSNTVDFTSEQCFRSLLLTKPEIDSKAGAATLGYLALFLSILSQYLNVQLPYEMQFMGSSSIIRKQGEPNLNKLVINAGERRSQAYSLAYDPHRNEDFQMALLQLSANVYYLSISQGIFIADKDNVPTYFLIHLVNLLEHSKGVARYLIIVFFY